MNRATGLPIYVGSIVGILMVEGFVVTSLDTAVRFVRYLLDEMWQVIFTGNVPLPLRNPWFNSGIAVAMRGLRIWFTVIPAAFMMVTTVASLLILMFLRYLPVGNWTLVIASLVLLVLAGALAGVAIRRTLELLRERTLSTPI